MAPQRALDSFAPSKPTPRGNPVWPVLGEVADAVLSALAAAVQLGTGELVAGCHQGHAGRIFLHEGRVAWVVAGGDRHYLSDVLERRAGVPAALLSAVYNRCLGNGTNLAEALVDEGHLDKATVRTALLEHNAMQLNRLMHTPMTSLRFTPKTRRYASDLIFTVDELASYQPPEALLWSNDDVVVPLSVTAPETTVGGSHITSSLQDLMTLGGAIAAALVDWQSGQALATINSGNSNGFDVGLVIARMNVMKALNVDGPIEDILITLKGQCHLIRPLSSNPSLLLYVAIDKNRGNLGLARHKVRQIESALTL